MTTGAMGADRGIVARDPGVARRQYRLTTGVIAAMAAVLLAAPGVGAQEQSSDDSHDAKVANDVNATATTSSEIKVGDIVSGHNTGNSVSTADTHQGNIVIDGGNFVVPTELDFYIDSGYSDAYADGGLNDAASSGPQQSMDVNRDVDVDADN